MKTFRVIRKEDGVTVYEYQSEIAIEWTGMEFTTHDHVEVIIVNEPEVPTVVIDKKITKLAFRNRFTLTEKVTIELAAVDNPSDPMEKRQLAAVLRANMADQRDATFIDLNDIVTRQGVQMLETYGLIGPGRASQILDREILATERLKQEGNIDG